MTKQQKAINELLTKFKGKTFSNHIEVIDYINDLLNSAYLLGYEQGYIKPNKNNPMPELTTLNQLAKHYGVNKSHLNYYYNKGIIKPILKLDKLLIFDKQKANKILNITFAID